MKNFFLNELLLFLMPLHYLLNFTQLKHSTVVSNASPIMHMASLFLKVDQNITLCCLNFYFVILFTLVFFP